MQRIFCKFLLLLSILLQQHHTMYTGGFGFNNAVLQDSTFQVAQSGRYYFSTKQEYKYNPINMSTSNPMIKITASDVSINFNDIGIINEDTSHAGWIGIEIGWSPQELLDDPSRIQPKNINIENISLYNFDCAIFVQAGVSGVLLRNCNIYKTLAGIMVLGDSASYCSDISLYDITVFGISGNYQSSLSLFKDRIETDYAYGADHFMPLKADPLNSNTVDMYTYYGMFFKYVNNLVIRNARVKDIGYELYETTSEGDGSRTEAVGIGIYNSKRIMGEDCFVDDTASEVKAVGLQLDCLERIKLCRSHFSYSTSAVKAVGLEVTNNESLDYSISSLSLYEFKAKSNVGGEVAIGIDVSSVRGLEGKDVRVKFNKGGILTYGLYSNKLYTCDIEEAKFSENASTRQTNDVATSQGIMTAGFYGENVHSLRLKDIDFTSMQALNTAYGLYLKDSSSILIFDSNFTANVASTMRSGEAAAIRSQQDSQEISMFAPVVEATMTGAYGMLLDACKYVRCENSSFNSNTAHRSFGISVCDSQSVGFWNCFASTQQATGQMFDATLVSEITDPTNMPTQLVHRPLLFGDMTKTSVDLVKTTDLYLEKLSSIQTAQAAGTEPSYADSIALAATQSLAQAAVARYRLWSIAVGIHAHNVNGCIINNCTCVGQISLFDNGMGICFSGRNLGHRITNCNLSYNAGAYAGLQTIATPGSSYAYSYNIVGMQPFWKTVLQQQEPWQLLDTITSSASVTSSVFSPDSSMIAVSDGNDVKIYAVSDGSLLQTLTGHTATITSLSWRPDGTQLASAASSAINNIKIWNTSTWVADQTLTHGSTGVNCLAYSPDETKLVSGSADATNNIAVWETTGWTSDTITHDTSVTAVAWRRDSVQFASGSTAISNNIKIWEYITSAWTVQYTFNSHTSGVNSLDWNSDNSQLASGSVDDTVKVWNMASQTVLQTLSPGAGSVHSVKYKPDDSLLAVGCASNAVHVYQTSDWSSETLLTDMTDAARFIDWIANGRIIAVSSNDTNIRLYITNIWKKASSATAVGLYTDSENYRLQDSASFASTIDNDTTFIDLLGTKRLFVSPIGPVTAGLVMGDMALESVVKDSKIYANIGNTGHAFGVLFNKAFSVTLDNSVVAGTNSNVHGMTAGVFDVTAHSPNLYFKNMFEGNKCSTYNNANYVIPFNPADPNGLSLPTKKIMNGKFSNITNDGYENLVIEYSQDSSFYSYESLATFPMHPDLEQQLTDNDCWS